MGQRLALTLAAVAAMCQVAAAAMEPNNLPNPTHSGYLDVDTNADSMIYYQYYEADSKWRLYVCRDSSGSCACQSLASCFWCACVQVRIQTYKRHPSFFGSRYASQQYEQEIEDVQQ